LLRYQRGIPRGGPAFWKQAGVAAKIDLRIGPALATLGGLLADGDSFDFAFIDADRFNYDAYYESCLALVRPGGVIAVDNVLWSGAVDPPRAGGHRRGEQKGVP